jgi:hypothetical protein
MRASGHRRWVGTDKRKEHALSTTLEFWTVEQAAERASVSPQTIHGWIRKGILPSAQAAPGGRHLIRPPDLAHLLEPKRRG